MPEIKKVFLRGKMNKDLDERLIPDGEYRDASNIQIASTESSHIGTIQNILGNKIVADTIAGGECVGIIENTETDKVYVFIRGASVHGIIEYDPIANTHQPLILDERDDKILDFSNITKITGITILDNFLIFTDNKSEPKIIDISSTSLFFNSLNSTSLYNYTSKINGTNFTEEDITLITKKPDEAPGVRIKVSSNAKTSTPIFENKFVRFAYRFVFSNGQRSPISPFTQPIFLPNEINSYDIDEGYNNQMENNIEEAQLFEFDTSHNSLERIEIVYKESNNANIYLYDSITKAQAEAANTATGNSPTDANRYLINKTVKKSVIPEDQLLRAFDNIPHRAKAVDVVGNRIVFGNYKDGLNVVNYNPIFQNIELEPRDTIDDEDTRKINVNGSLLSGVITGTGSSINDTRTIKTGRDYEIGIVFEDKYGRQTPVITADGGAGSGTKKVPFDTGGTAGTNLKITMGGSFPSDPRLTKFKFYIKPSSNNFDNLIVETIKNDKEDSGTCWLVVPSYEINKVKEGQYMMLKKALNSNTRLIYNDPTTNPPITPDNFKFKILDISGDKPENIEASETFDGKFFIKIKKTNQITSNIFTNQGIAGNNGNITDVDFKETAVPSGALFIGQYVVPEYDEDLHVEYWFKDGEIYEVEKRSSGTLAPNQANTFNTNVNSGMTSGNHTINGVTITGYAKLPDNASKSNWTGSYTDSTGTVDNIYVKIAGADSASDFYIEYSGQNPGSNVSANTSPAVFETIPEDEVLDIYYETSECFDKNQWGADLDIDWHNAYIMGNGVESSTINDDFNEDTIAPGVKVSTTIEGDYSERHQKSSLIYSGIYNSLGGINKLNEFNTGLKITKELNPEYGSIQKLYTRDTNILAFCEDKLLKVLANKDALFNADGNVNLTATENVLGQAIAFAGDYGISKNPESFAVHGYRIYFADRARGVILRVSGDGSTVISDTGMSSYFRDKLLVETGQIIGSYDLHSDQYILTLPVANTSVSFSEDTKGWTSRLDFIPEAGVSINGNYYTCYAGKLYLHHAAGEPRGVFYGQNYTAGIKLIFNQDASAIKNFKNISYEGTTGWETTDTGIETDQQQGRVIEFKEKENKYFGLISGIDNKLEDINDDEITSRLKDFSIQGLGNIVNIQGSTEFTCATANFAVANSNTTDANGNDITSISQSSSVGTIVSVSPSTIQSGVQTYSANIQVPNGFSNSGEIIPCTDTATGTVINQVFDCNTANFQVANGTVGDTVTGTVDAGTIASISPSTYQSGATVYTATINIPGSGYTNSGTVSCTDTFTATGTSCAFSLGVTTYSSGGTTLSGTFTGTDIGTNPTINLSVASGTISPTSTTKSALASGSGITVTASEGVLVTATISGGLCNNEQATINMPQASTVVITGSGAGMVGDNILLSTNTTGVVTSYQWHKSGTSGFTPSNSTAIAGANSSSLTVSESAASTQYYKVVINGPGTSPQHDIVWTAWTSHSNLKYSSGTSVNLAACTSSTTQNLFANGSFTSANRFAVNNQGSTTNFQQGTYSDGTNYRFINSGGIPGSHTACTGGGTQGIRVTKCRDANSSKDILVTVPTNTNALQVNDIISFTEIYDNNTAWVVTQVGLTLQESQYDALRTLATTHVSCLVADPPTISLSGPSEIFVGETISLTASPSFIPQGASFTYIFRKSTDGSTPTTQIAETTNATITETAQTSNLGSAVTNKYTVEIKNTSPLIKSTVTDVDVKIYNTLFFGAVLGGSSANSSACTQTPNDYTRFANTTTVSSITKLYKTAQGGSFSSNDAGTYAKDNLYAYFDSNGNISGGWNNCPAPSESVTIFFGGSSSNKTNRNPYESLLLETTPSNFTAGSTLSYEWTQTQGPGSGSTVLSTSSTFTAELALSDADNLASGSTIQKTFKCKVTGSVGNESAEDEITISWQGKSQQLEIFHCTSNDTEYVKVINSDGYNNNDVINIVDSTGAITNGCYKILTAGHTSHESYDDVKIYSSNQRYPFNATSTCCNCSSCSASITTNSSGTVGTNQSFAASFSGFTISGSSPKYKWYSTTVENDRLNSSATSWNEITSVADQQSFNLSNSQAETLYYMVKVYGFNATTTNVIEHGFATVNWSPAASTPIARSYSLQTYDEFNCPNTADVGYVYGNYTSISALAAGTTVTLSGNSSTCYKVVNSINTYNSSYSSIDNDYASCQQCYNTINQDCSFTLNAGNTYNGSNGTALFTANIGTSADSTDTISLAATDNSTVSPTSTTVGALESGLNVTIGQGKTLRATITSGTCNNTSQTAQAPSLNCQAVTLYYSTSDPASSSSAKADLCGSGNTRSFRLNAGSLSLATQLYTDSSCSTLESGTKYFSQNNIEYYVWNGSSFSSGIPLNCDSGQGGNQA